MISTFIMTVGKFSVRLMGYDTPMMHFRVILCLTAGTSLTMLNINTPGQLLPSGRYPYRSDDATSAEAFLQTRTSPFSLEICS